MIYHLNKTRENTLLICHVQFAHTLVQSSLPTISFISSSTISFYHVLLRPTGLAENNIVLGKHSGRNAFRTRLKELSYNLSDDELNRAFVRFKELADKKKDISTADLEALANDASQMITEDRYKMVTHSFSMLYLLLLIEINYLFIHPVVIHPLVTHPNYPQLDTLSLPNH